ncbi:hypothetical protein JCM19240_3977 [Vibrio maritimus]|uniref:Uncharacterized protein n=1 Tax=Vibrio maritimus TaxID=990268 RepID=A0A090TEF0_9VIBR|nr:hypothetical protein JCM19240_3977 [Vibrio maritimus]
MKKSIIATVIAAASLSFNVAANPSSDLEWSTQTRATCGITPASGTGSLGLNSQMGGAGNGITLTFTTNATNPTFKYKLSNPQIENGGTGMTASNTKVNGVGSYASGVAFADINPSTEYDQGINGSEVMLFTATSATAAQLPAGKNTAKLTVTPVCAGQ